MVKQQDSDLPLQINYPENAPKTPKMSFKMKYLIILILPLFMFLGAVLGMYFQPPGLQKFYILTGLEPGAGSKSPIAIPPEINLPKEMELTLLPSDVVGLAKIIPQGDIAIVASPYGAGDARVAKINVSIGDEVSKDDPLAYLDNRDTLESAVLLAEAGLAVREASVIQTKHAVQASRDEAQASLDLARASAIDAQANFERTQALKDKGLTTAAALDSAKSRQLETLQSVTRAEATLARFSSIAIEEQPDVVVAERNFESAKAELARAKLDLNRSVVRAPIEGTILDIHVTPGQRPPVDGIMEMGNTRQMMAEVEIWQDRIVEVKVGQPVELTANSLKEKLLGTVQQIGITVGRQGLISDDAAANSDARVFTVLVKLDQASSKIASRYTNLEAIARIDSGASIRLDK